MKKIILSALLAAFALCSCKTATREYRNPTYPGYMMLVNNISGYKAFSGKLALMFQIDEYIGAETDEERERVHDKYFYREYVAYDDAKGLFTIRYDTDELFVSTGGKRIGETGAEWSGMYENQYEFMPVVKCIGENRYEITYNESDYPRFSSDRYKVSVEAEVGEASAVSGGMSLKMTGTCESRNKSDNGTFIVEGYATDLIWQGNRFLTGTVELTTENRGVIDNAKAEFSEDGSFTVWYGGSKDVYSLYDLEYYGYFMYE